MSVKTIVPKAIQTKMDKNLNCCLNCYKFKLLWDKEDDSPNSIAGYYFLRARCSDDFAKKEKIERENSICLRSFAYSTAKIPDVRKDCKYFDLG